LPTQVLVQKLNLFNFSLRLNSVSGFSNSIPQVLQVHVPILYLDFLRSILINIWRWVKIMEMVVFYKKIYYLCKRYGDRL